MSEANATTQVEYRQIQRFEGYRFGRDGSVWSEWSRGNRPKRTGLWHRLKPLRARYEQITLGPRPAKNVYAVHRLIAEAFLGSRPSGMLVCHNDGNPFNNEVANLRYDTPKGNSHDMIAHGTHQGLANNPNSKLTEGDVISIRERAAKGEPQYRIAESLGVSANQISLIVRRKQWATVA